ncbi:glycosyltransferase, partial [Methylobacterium sp. sgz302542]|uniref:glycosyltransferase n=1 Tax=Methylobacterium sp. sgz302542 TaxID=3418176 RepID=UPI003EBCEC9E
MTEDQAPEDQASLPAGGPEVSVVISVKDRKALLAECLEALAAQSLGLARFEVVVVDNVSRDDIAAVCAEARSRGLDIRCLRMERDRGGGGGGSRDGANERGQVPA